MRLQRLAHSILLAGCLILTTVFPTAANWKDGKLGHLFQYVGTTKYETVMNEPHVKQAMEELLGGNIPHLKQNLQVRGTIDVEGPYLVMWGNKPHEAHIERAVLVINAFDGTVHAAIFSKGITTIYSRMDNETTEYFEPEEHFGLLPNALRYFSLMDEIYELTLHEPKSNFRWVK